MATTITTLQDWIARYDDAVQSYLNSSATVTPIDRRDPQQRDAFEKAIQRVVEGDYYPEYSNDGCQYRAHLVSMDLTECGLPHYKAFVFTYRGEEEQKPEELLLAPIHSKWKDIPGLEINQKYWFQHVDACVTIINRDGNPQNLIINPTMGGIVTSKRWFESMIGPRENPPRIAMFVVEPKYHGANRQIIVDETDEVGFIEVDKRIKKSDLRIDQMSGLTQAAQRFMKINTVDGVSYRKYLINRWQESENDPEKNEKLVKAAVNGNRQIADAALRLGANVNGIAKSGELPLNIALYFNRIEFARWLLDRCGADPEARDGHGQNAKDVIESTGNFQARVLMLFAK